MREVLVSAHTLSRPARPVQARPCGRRYAPAWTGTRQAAPLGGRPEQPPLGRGSSEHGAENMQAQAFLRRYTARLIAIANAASPELQGSADIGQLLNRVHADFEAVVDKPGKRPSLPGEDVFWWCVTILEELAEITRRGTTTEPYISMMIDQLRSMGSRLANSEPLPPEFQIHWFDDPAAEDDAD